MLQFSGLPGREAGLVGNPSPPALAHLWGAGPPFTTLADPCCPETGVTDIPPVARATRSPELKLDWVAGLFDKGPRFEVNWEGTMLLKMRRKKPVFGEAPTTRQADRHFPELHRVFLTPL